MSFPGLVTPDALIAEITGLVSGQDSAFPRSIGGIIANVTVEEEGVDELTITKHPVEQGASITDHAYKQPARLTLRVGWSNSSLEAGFDSNYVIDVYNKLLALQVAANPFTVVTGKRQYTNMLMESLRLRTDPDSELALDVIVVCQEVIIVQTTPTSVPPLANQAAPELTAPTQNLGEVQLSSLTLPDLPNFGN